jgi:hypothetical protein
MNLGELLQELRENILHDASDEVNPPDDGYLWSNSSLVRYINDGQNQFATRTLLLRDERNPFTRIELVPGKALYDVDARIVYVFGARIGDHYHLGRSSYATLFSNRGALSVGGPIYDGNASGRPRFFYTDRETNTLGVYPAPDEQHAGVALTLRVARKPLTPLVATQLEAVPEIPEEFQLDILEWAAWRALRNRDPDGESQAKASAHKTRFNDALAELDRKAKRMLAEDMQFDLRNDWRR